jgi:hypothetical protein
MRLTGFMVRMEDPPRDALCLAPKPVDCDESGAGDAAGGDPGGSQGVELTDPGTAPSGWMPVQPAAFPGPSEKLTSTGRPGA